MLEWHCRLIAGSAKLPDFMVLQSWNDKKGYARAESSGQGSLWGQKLILAVVWPAALVIHHVRLRPWTVADNCCTYIVVR